MLGKDQTKALKMTENLKRIEAEILEKISNGDITSEFYFDAGVRIGRELQLNNLPDYRLELFKEIEDDKALKRKFSELHKKVCDWLERLVKLSIKDHISQNLYGVWTVGLDNTFLQNCVFDESIVEKRFVQYSNLRRGEGDHFIAFFTVEGKLKKIFEKHLQPIKFEIVVDNDDGGDNLTIKNLNQIESLYGCMANYNCNIDFQGVNEYENFVNEIEKCLLFILME